jgi:hypothetical protein
MNARGIFIIVVVMAWIAGPVARPSVAGLVTKELMDNTRDSGWTVSWNDPDANNNTSDPAKFKFTGIAAPNQKQGDVFFDVTFKTNKMFVFTFDEELNTRPDNFGLRLTLKMDVHNMTNKPWTDFAFNLKDLSPLNADQALRLTDEGLGPNHPAAPHFHSARAGADGAFSVAPFNDPGAGAINAQTFFVVTGGPVAIGKDMTVRGLGLHDFEVRDMFRHFELQLLPSVAEVPEPSTLILASSAGVILLGAAYRRRRRVKGV